MRKATGLLELVANLEVNLDGIREKQGVSKARYERDTDLQDIVERRLEKATQTCIDISRRIGRLEGRDLSKATNPEVFVALVDLGVLPSRADRNSPISEASANVLAHRYRQIDSAEIYETYHDLERFERFSEAVYQYLQRDDP